MANALKTYFDFSQLSMAAYASLIPGSPSAIALTGAGFSTPLANQFVSTNNGYEVRSVSPSNDPLSFGFSATLLEKLDNGNRTGQFTLAIRGTDDAADFLIDAVSVGILGSENLNPQYGKLKDYVDFLLDLDNGFLTATDKLIVTGHSLGGFLAQGLAADSAYASRIDKVYTYNAPGFGGAAGTILEALGVTNPLIDAASAAKVTNLVASNGLSPIAGLGAHIGQVLPVFIGEENGDILHYRAA